MICKLCKKDFKGFVGLGTHISTIHSITNEEYYNKFLKNEDGEGRCLKCEEETSFLDLRRGFRLYCSRSCMQSSQEIIKKKKDTYLKNYGVDNYAKSDKFKRTHNFSKNNRKKANITCLERYGVENVSQIEDVKKKKRETSFKNYGVSNYTKTEEYINEMKNGRAAFMNNFITNPSKPQVELFQLCQQVFPYPVLNYPCGRYSIDIAIPILNLAIEYDGSYWHQDEEYDKRRQEFIESEGWKVIRYVDRIPTLKELKGI